MLKMQCSKAEHCYSSHLIWHNTFILGNSELWRFCLLDIKDAGFCFKIHPWIWKQNSTNNNNKYLLNKGSTRQHFFFRCQIKQVHLNPCVRASVSACGEADMCVRVRAHTHHKTLTSLSLCQNIIYSTCSFGKIRKGLNCLLDFKIMESKSRQTEKWNPRHGDLCPRARTTVCGLHWQHQHFIWFHNTLLSPVHVTTSTINVQSLKMIRMKMDPFTNAWVNSRTKL